MVPAGELNGYETVALMVGGTERRTAFRGRPGSPIPVALSRLASMRLLAIMMAAAVSAREPGESELRSSWRTGTPAQTPTNARS
jgi:hypothetical protein